MYRLDFSGKITVAPFPVRKQHKVPGGFFFVWRLGGPGRMISEYWDNRQSLPLLSLPIAYALFFLFVLLTDDMGLPFPGSDFFALT
jgi:hypothetical protein